MAPALRRRAAERRSCKMMRSVIVPPLLTSTTKVLSGLQLGRESLPCRRHRASGLNEAAGPGRLDLDVLRRNPMYALSVTVPESVFASSSIRSLRANADLDLADAPKSLAWHVDDGAVRQPDGALAQDLAVEEVGARGNPRRMPYLRKARSAWGLLDVAAVHDHDPMGRRHHLLLVVRDVDERNPDVVLQMRFSSSCISSRSLRSSAPKGSIKEQETRGRLTSARASAIHLCAPPETLLRLPPLQPGEPDELEGFGDAPANLAALHAAAAEAEANVLEDQEGTGWGGGTENTVFTSRLYGGSGATSTPPSWILRSAPQNRRSSVASWSCRSPTARGARGRAAVRKKRDEDTATTSSKRFVSPISRMS